METRKIPFDVEKAKRGAKVVTRDGRNVEIIHFNKKGGDYPIVALVDNVVYKGISQEIYCYTTKGRYTFVNPTKYDLLIEEEVEEQGEQKSYKEETTHRLMTYQELADWLRDNPEEYREYTYADSSAIRNTFAYRDEDASKLADNILVRRNHGEWEKPLVEL